MKTKILVLILGCVAVAACDKQSDEKQPENTLLVMTPDSTHVYSVNEDGKETLSQITYYTYDAGHHLTEQIDSTINSTTGISKTIIKKRYDANGYIVEEKETYYVKSLNRWQNGRCWVYKYDSQNRLSLISIYESFTEPLDPFPTKKAVYTWGDDAHASSLVYHYDPYKSTTDPWIIEERDEYTYNAEGKIDNVVCWWLWGTDSQAGGNLLYISEYKYDQNGNIVSLIRRDEKNVLYQENNQYEYDDKGNVLVKWLQSSSSIEGENKKEKYLYFY